MTLESISRQSSFYYVQWQVMLHLTENRVIEKIISSSGSV
jgi:hypothetical protein